MVQQELQAPRSILDELTSPEPTWHEDNQAWMDSAKSEERASARFLWIDEESGDEILVDVSGDVDFFRELENIGFLRHAGEGLSSASSNAAVDDLRDHDSEALDSDEREPDAAPRRSKDERLRVRMEVSSRTRTRERDEKLDDEMQSSEIRSSAARPRQERRRA